MTDQKRLGRPPQERAMSPEEFRRWMDQTFGTSQGKSRWGNIAEAARVLGMHRTTVERKLRGAQPITREDVERMQQASAAG